MEEKILAILGDINEEILYYDGTNMMFDGIVDSFEIVEIVTRIENEFDLEIDAKDIVAENFKNKNTIIEMVNKVLNS